MRRTLILSDIYQTGLPPASLYRKVADIILHKGIERLIGIGPVISDNAYLFNLEKEFYPTTESFLAQLDPADFHNELILIKGAREFHFELISETLELKQHETILEINLDAIVHNYNLFKSKLRPETKIICMVKAFGYGAGSYELAKTLQDRGADFLAVAVADNHIDVLAHALRAESGLCEACRHGKEVNGAVFLYGQNSRHFRVGDVDAVY